MKYLPLVALLLGAAPESHAIEPQEAAKALGVPENPTTDDLRYRPLLPMPYFEEQGAAPKGETDALLVAIASYRKGGREDRHAPLNAFLSDHPASTYRLWIEGSVALDLHRSGRHSEALSAWEAAWTRTRGMFAKEPRNRAYVGRVGVELGELYARLGRKEELGSLLAELDQFPLLGPVTERRQRIREGYTEMGLHPERSFNCGPYALANALRATVTPADTVKAIVEAKGKGNGFSLGELDGLIRKQGLEWRPGKLEEGGELVFPCVVHWKAGHYACALEGRGGKILVQDPTFEFRKWIPRKDFLVEASGYFVIPGKELPEGWRSVTDEELTSVRGMGAPNSRDDSDDPCDSGCSDGGPGMPSYGYNDFLTGAVINDTPLVLESPFGPGLGLSLSYRENSKLRDTANMPFTNVGTKWSFNYLSFIRQDATYTTKYRLYLPGGRQETHVDTGSGFQQNRMSQSQLTAIAGGYKRTSNDGAELVFDRLSDDGLRYYLTSITDPQGNSLTLHYADGPGGTGDRLDYVQDSFGRKLRFDYNEADGYLVSKVVEVIGGTDLREVNLGYNSGELVSITDVEGIESSFTYGSPTDLSGVTTMTTPYGTTRFEQISFTKPHGTITLYYSALTITDPLGMKEHVLYAPHLSDTAFPEMDETPFQDLSSANNPFTGMSGSRRTVYLDTTLTLYWDKKANKYHPPDFQTGKGFEFARAKVWMVGYDSVLLSKALPYVDALKVPETAVHSWKIFDYNNDVPGNHSPTNPIDFLPRAEGHLARNETGTVVGAVTYFGYTANGLPASVTDPLGRRVAYAYAGNGIDVTEVWVGDPASGNPGTWQVGKMVYGGSVDHLPTEIYDAANSKTTIGYNAKGQVTKVTNALGEETEFTYGWPTGFTDPTPGSTAADNDGFLQSVSVTDSTNGISDVEILSVTYHANTGHINTVTDALTGQTTTYNTYDALGRVTKVTHPDASSEEFFFEKDGVKYIDLIRHLNREGKSTHYSYNGNRQLVSVVDPELRNTRIKWCSCGHIEALTDAFGRHTEWKRDLLGRVTRKILPDGKEISYTYEAESGRLSTVTNPNEQGGTNASISFKYFIDGLLAEKIYPGDTDPFFAKFTYDALLGRMQTAKWHDEDGVEQSTTYGYSAFLSALGGTGTAPGAGMLHTTDGPWSNDTVVQIYDAVGRQVGTDIANDGSPWGSPTFSTSITSIDGLGRIKQHINNLGTFTTAYTGNDPRPDSISTGSFTTAFDYLPSNQGGYLSQIHNTHGSTTISKFNYTYTPDGKISTWAKEQGGTVKFMDFVYDLAGQLKKATTRQTNASGVILQTLAFGYDRAGNRTSRTEDGAPRTANFNARNQFTTGDFLGEIPFIGEMDEFAEVSVTVNGVTKPARVREHGSEWLFETEVKLELDGTTQVDVDATDVSDNTTSESFEIDSGSGQWASLTYDDNGNTLTRTVTGITTTYTWDRENRLEKVFASGAWYQFVYNAVGERVKIIRDPGGAQDSERRFVWTGGNQPSQERTAGNEVVKNFFAEGEHWKYGASFRKDFYTRDHLGSVREFVREDGFIGARFDYSPFGVREEMGSMFWEPTLGFTGHFHHGPTGHMLTLFRAYDPELGRWLSPDPLGEAAASFGNLYSYGPNDPLSGVDRLGGPWHHLVNFAAGLDAGLPEAFIKSKDNGWMLTVADHKLLHSRGWTAEWNAFFKSKGGACTPRQARRQLKTMMNDPKFSEILKRGSKATIDDPNHPSRMWGYRRSRRRGGGGAGVLGLLGTATISGASALKFYEHANDYIETGRELAAEEAIDVLSDQPEGIQLMAVGYIESAREAYSEAESAKCP